MNFPAIFVKAKIIKSANTFIQNKGARSSAEFAYIFGIFRPEVLPWQMFAQPPASLYTL